MSSVTWHPGADVEQLKSILAAAIIGVLDDRKLSVRKAEGVTGMRSSRTWPIPPVRADWRALEDSNL